VLIVQVAVTVVSVLLDYLRKQGRGHGCRGNLTGALLCATRHSSGRGRMTYARGDTLLSRDKASIASCVASTVDFAASKTQTRFRPLSLAK
jgi:hypothetical protein